MRIIKPYVDYVNCHLYVIYMIVIKFNSVSFDMISSHSLHLRHLITSNHRKLMLKVINYLQIKSNLLQIQIENDVLTIEKKKNVVMP